MMVRIYIRYFAIMFVVTAFLVAGGGYSPAFAAGQSGTAKTAMGSDDGVNLSSAGDVLMSSAGNMAAEEDPCANPDPDKKWPWGLNPCEEEEEDDEEDIEYNIPKDGKPRTDMKVRELR